LIERESMSEETNIRRVALLGNHLPRQCGIATFTTDLKEAIAAAGPEIDCFVLAMNDGRHQHAYPGSVRFELTDNDAGAYTRRRFSERQCRRRNLRTTRVRDFRRQGRQLSPAASPRAPHADRDYTPHDPGRAESSSAACNG
jgi:hypothetical protein